MHLVASLDKHFPVLYSMLKDHIADDVNYKVSVLTIFLFCCKSLCNCDRLLEPNPFFTHLIYLTVSTVSAGSCFLHNCYDDCPCV